ncbi:hypothetical protein ZIOFF_020786 [Zingiber officinale]|uniref:CUE domain-containing protein n=1 Tax=Zingiber officinale TaxID=94328 RepID=A0A8J5LGS4_ZINOF|nr:hypothetical protein ZIOFF_020786 [Zingiber officinale]
MLYVDGTMEGGRRSKGRFAIERYMDFKEVFASLQEIFPQVDLRILKAVAIEHPSDVDAAAESILVEILPSIVSFHEASSTPPDANEVAHASTSTEKHKQPMFCEHQEEKETTNHLSDKDPVVWENTVSSCGSSSVNTGSSCIVETGARDSQVSLANYSRELEYPTSDINALEEVNTNSSSEGNVKENELDLNHGGVLPSNPLFEQFVDALNDISQDDIVPIGSSNLAQEDECPSGQHVIQPSIEKSHTASDDMHETSQALCDKIAISFRYEHQQLKKLDINLNSIDQHPQLESLDIDLNSIAKEQIMSGGSYILDGSMEQSGFPVQPLNTLNFSELVTYDSVLDYDTSGPCIKAYEIEDSEGRAVSEFATVTSAFEKPLSKFSDKGATEFISSENGLLPTNDNPPTLLTRSGHFVDIELLAGMISDAKDKKDSLLSAVELTGNLMRDVELLEERSKHAKEAASNAGEDILSKTEELKISVVHAKEENDKLGGIIYGEKAILATEAQELQSRLLSLSNERNKSLSVIEEIHQTLMARITALNEEIAASEQEKLEKEAAAQRVLSEQEVIMASIVEESKKLQEEVEKNSKFREFLMDRGCMVDILQGEIAIICEDVMLLKERLDTGLPLGRSLRGMPSSLSASSGSSHSRSKHSSLDVPLELEGSTETLSIHNNIVVTPSSTEQAKLVTKHPLQSNFLGCDIRSASVTDNDGWEFLKDDMF